MNETRNNTRARLAFAAVFAAMVAGFIAAGFIYYRSYEEHYRAEVGNQLSAIAELKVNELNQWRRERLSDGQIFTNNPAFSALVRRFLGTPEDPMAKREIQAWISKIQTFGQYDAVRLLDAKGFTLLSAPSELEPASAEVVHDALARLRAKEVSFRDFYRSDRSQRVHLAVIAPISDELDANRLLGVLVLRIDPFAYLYPFISRWPTPSQTAETLLVRREGNDVLFLNELRFQKGTALNLRFPLTQTELPSVKAVLGQPGIVTGTDYRGAPVVAALRAVPRSPWFMVTRMNTDEIYAPMRERLWQVVGLISLTIFAAGTGIGYVWRQQRAHHYRERLGVAEALRESERFLIESQKAAGIGSYILDLAAGIWRSSGVLDELFGIDAAVTHSVELWTTLVHPDERQAMNEYFAVEVVQKRGRFDREYRIVRPRDGATRWVHGLGELEYDPEHRPVRMIGTIQDITERKLVEEKLLHVMAAVESSSNAIGISDLQGRHFYQNQAYTELFGYATAAELQAAGGGVITVCDQAVGKELFETILAGRTWWGELKLVTKSGRVFDAFERADAIKDPSGKMIGLVGIVTDITERKKQEVELREKNAELERFTYTVSHDLKSPLITIKGFAGALLHDVQAGKHQRLEGDLRRVAEAADKMSNLLTDLLELSRIGRVVHPPSEVALDLLLPEVLRQLAGPISQRHAQVVLQPGLPVVWADRSRLAEVWQNLIENALKFPGNQPVRIEIGQRGPATSPVFFVRDNGVGIDPRYHETVFGLFNKLDGKTEGTGIGLALVHRIIEFHGGRIWVDSEGLGHGSTFCFTLPRTKPATQPFPT